MDGCKPWSETFLLYSKVDSDSRVGCHLHCAPRSYLRQIILKETCLFFPQVWTLCWRSMYWIKSLSAQSYPRHWLPSNPASPKAIPRAFVQTHTGGGARLEEAEKRRRLRPKWLLISRSDTPYLLVTQLLINNLRCLRTSHLISVTHLHWASHWIYI